LGGFLDANDLFISQQKSAPAHKRTKSVAYNNPKKLAKDDKTTKVKKPVKD